MELNGRVLAPIFSEKLKTIVSKKDKNDRPTKLVVISTVYDEASLVYQKARNKLASSLNIVIEEVDCSTFGFEELIFMINSLNHDNNIDGIMLNRPIREDLNYFDLANKIIQKKDVEGVSANNIGLLNQNIEAFIAPTAFAVFLLMKHYIKKITGKRVVIVGRSPSVGKPLANLLINENCSVLTAHSKSVNLKKITRFAQILIVAIGKPNFIDVKYVKRKQILIDVGYHLVDNQIFGDITLEAKEYSNMSSPVPGGVGSLTNYTLLFNLLKARYPDIKNTDFYLKKIN
jgi:methylenetetrahydrofolate dehydrogenase (NADP+)/methenyltetrahydrofolate cyclohydrolase